MLDNRVARVYHDTMVVLLALRNLSRQKRRTFLLGGAIAIGIFVVTMINGFAGSFVKNVSENFSHLLAGHIFLAGAEKSIGGVEYPRIADETPLIEAMREIDLPATILTRRTRMQSALIFQGVSVRQALVGVDWVKEQYLRDRLILLDGAIEDMQIVNDSGERNGIIITENVAKKLNAEVGDRLIVRIRTVYRQQNVGDFVVRGISFDPQLFGQLSAFADLSYVNELVSLAPEEYQILGIFVEDMQEADKLASSYYQALTKRVNVLERRDEDVGQNPILALFRPADTQTWEGIRYTIYTINDMVSEVDQIVRLLNGAALVILFVLFVIIMVGITNTFRMIMYERIKEIGTMRALGMQRPSVQRIFLFEAFFLSMGGVLAGLLLAGVVMAIVAGIDIGIDSTIGILLDNGHFSFLVLPRQVILNVMIVASLTIVAAIIPARMAARLRPVTALRAE
jgi:putative ABC transport system permease protein